MKTKVKHLGLLSFRNTSLKNIVLVFILSLNILSGHSQYGTVEEKMFKNFQGWLTLPDLKKALGGKIDWNARLGNKVDWSNLYRILLEEDFTSVILDEKEFWTLNYNAVKQTAWVWVSVREEIGGKFIEDNVFRSGIFKSIEIQFSNATSNYSTLDEQIRKSCKFIQVFKDIDGYQKRKYQSTDNVDFVLWKAAEDINCLIIRKLYLK
jgi:hypothetical protein